MGVGSTFHKPEVFVKLNLALVHAARRAEPRAARSETEKQTQRMQNEQRKVNEAPESNIVNDHTPMCFKDLGKTDTFLEECKMPKLTPE